MNGPLTLKSRQPNKVCFLFCFVVVSYGANPGSLGRRLLSSSNSTSHGPVWEDCSWEKDHLPGIWICIHFICILIIFIGKCICFFTKVLRVLALFCGSIDTSFFDFW